MKHLWFLLIVIITLFFFLSVESAKRESLTYDELVHAEEGLHHVTDRTFAVDTNNPPLIRELAMLPIWLKGKSLSLSSRQDDVLSARIVMVLLGVLLLTSVYRMVSIETDRTTGVLAATILAFEPTILGHSHYIALDVGVTLFTFLSYWAFISMLKRKSVTMIMVMGIVTGLAFASKIIAIPFLVMSIVFFLVGHVGLRLGSILLSRRTDIVIVSLITCATIWATYGFRFDTVIVSRSDPTRMSARMREFVINRSIPGVPEVLTFFETTPIPLGNYLATIKNTFVRSLAPTSVYFFGTLHERTLWYMLPMTLLLKVPIPVILFIMVGVTLLRGNKRLRVYAYPVVAMLLVSLVTKLPPQVRYILPMYPFLAIIAAIGMRSFLFSKKRIIVTVALFWLIGGTLREYPHFISYGNEFSGKKEQRYNVFVDSNIDWGQALPDISSTLTANHFSLVRLSYFGRDNGDRYGLISDKQWGSFRFDEICAFHTIHATGVGSAVEIISVTNWYYCGYHKTEQYSQDKIIDHIGASYLLFPYEKRS